MAEIVLLIPDAALREAVIEQIKAAKLGVPRIADSVQAVDPKTDKSPPIVILDDQGEKNRSIIAALNEREEKPVLLMLGTTDDIEGLTESFPKPFRLGHLITKLRYYLETTPLLRNRIVSFGPYRLESNKRQITRDQAPEPIRLTEKETALLVFLAQNQEAVTRKEILEYVWGYDERIDTHTLETHIYQLRRKLDKEGESWIISESGTYRLAEMHQ